MVSKLKSAFRSESIRLKKGLIFAVILVFALAQAFSLDVPALTAHVNDKARIMKQSDVTTVENYLVSLEEATGIQIAVLTIPSLEGENISSYALKVAEKWKLGQKGKDNGALLLVAYGDHEVRIEVGYGLEGLLTDTKCGLIIRNVIIPEFKNGNYSAGIVKGVKNMGGVASENMEIVERSVQKGVEEDGSIVGLIFMIVWLIVFLSIITSRGGLLKWLLLSNLMGRRGSHHHHYGGGGFSSGHSSGSSFGGFSGGGGHFGGGGASGRW